MLLGRAVCKSFVDGDVTVWQSADEGGNHSTTHLTIHNYTPITHTHTLNILGQL